MKNAYFAGGCFWCITPSFTETDGVFGVVSGYSGGDEINPAYEEVKAQKTGHREAIKIEYDETKVEYGRLLDIFLENVDPFDKEGQYIDRGFSYTLAVFFENDEEKRLAQERIDKIAEASGKEVYISLEPFRSFYDAEEYHQMYYLKNPEAFEKEMIESGRKSR